MHIRLLNVICLALAITLATPAYASGPCPPLLTRLYKKISRVLTDVSAGYSARKKALVIRKSKSVEEREADIDEIDLSITNSREGLNPALFTQLARIYIKKVQPKKRQFTQDLKLFEMLRKQSLNYELADAQKVSIAKEIFNHFYFPETRDSLFDLLLEQWGRTDDMPPDVTSETVSKSENKIEAGRSNMMEGRTLRKGAASYAHMMMIDQFISDFRAIKSGQVWLDGGSGEFAAPADALDDRELFDPEAKVIAITKDIPLNHSHLDYLNAKYPTRFKSIFGKVEDVPDEEIGPVDFTSDIYGAYAYARHFEMVINKYLTNSKVGAKIYIRSEASDRSISISLRGVRVEISEWYRYMAQRHGFKIIMANHTVVALEKTADSTPIPQMTLAEISAGFPPWRSYRWK